VTSVVSNSSKRHAKPISINMTSQATQTDTGLSHSIMGSVSRWSRQSGKDMEFRLNKAIQDEETKDPTKLTKKQRKINLELLGKALLPVTNFAYITRHLTRQEGMLLSYAHSGTCVNGSQSFSRKPY
jgi:hypothetical protein